MSLYPLSLEEPPADIEWRYIKGLVRKDGLCVTVRSTRLFTFASPERMAARYDRGELDLGSWRVSTTDEPDAEFEYTVVTISKK